MKRFAIVTMLAVSAPADGGLPQWKRRLGKRLAAVLVVSRRRVRRRTDLRLDADHARGNDHGTYDDRAGDSAWTRRGSPLELIPAVILASLWRLADRHE